MRRARPEDMSNKHKLCLSALAVILVGSAVVATAPALAGRNVQLRPHAAHASPDVASFFRNWFTHNSLQLRNLTNPISITTGGSVCWFSMGSPIGSSPIDVMVTDTRVGSLQDVVSARKRNPPGGSGETEQECQGCYWIQHTDHTHAQCANHEHEICRHWNGSACYHSPSGQYKCL